MPTAPKQHGRIGRLSDAQVRKIRQQWHERKKTQAELATDTGMSQPQISLIIQRKAYQHVK